MGLFKKQPSAYDDPVNGQRWYENDLNSAKEVVQKEKALFNVQLKDAAERGIKASIETPVGGILPPPPGYDIFAGKTCCGPGKPSKFGRETKCGRQATVLLVRLTPEVPDKSMADVERDMMNGLSQMAYGGSSAIPGVTRAGSSPGIGRQVHDPFSGPDPNGTFVCFYHSQNAYVNAVHPEDNGGVLPNVEPDAPEDLEGIERLDTSRRWRALGQDSMFVWLTDGVTSVREHKSRYVEYLRENGSVPENGVF